MSRHSRKVIQISYWQPMYTESQKMGHAHCESYAAQCACPVFLRHSVVVEVLRWHDLGIQCRTPDEQRHFVPVTLYSTLGFEKKHFLDYCDRKQQKQMLANKHNSCSSLYVQLTTGVFVSQYCKNVDFISMSEAAQMGASPLETAAEQMWCISVWQQCGILWSVFQQYYTTTALNGLFFVIWI